MTERRIRILQRTSFSRHAKVLQGKLSPMQAAQLANQLGGREACLVGCTAGLLVGWLVGWTCCSNFAPFGNLSSRILRCIFLSFSLSLSLSLYLSLLYSISSSVFSPNFVPFFLICLLPYSRLAEDCRGSRAKKMAM